MGLGIFPAGALIKMVVLVVAPEVQTGTEADFRDTTARAELIVRKEFNLVTTELAESEYVILEVISPSKEMRNVPEQLGLHTHTKSCEVCK